MIDSGLPNWEKSMECFTALYSSSETQGVETAKTRTWERGRGRRKGKVPTLRPFLRVSLFLLAFGLSTPWVSEDALHCIEF